jgi:hypothetical protein
MRQQRIRKYRSLVKQQRRHQKLLERGAYTRPALSFNWDVEVASRFCQSFSRRGKES